ncbi:MAG: hypothetical protein JW932_09020 [Deltaproteobacteria bacterium]|nr:hypothetical protein [Deltaproteobacteria bacterium]
MSEICYICGKAIEENLTSDHVPPQQIFAQSIRREYNLSQLITLTTHRECNENYRLDEDYFAWSLAPIAMGSSTADAVINHHAKEFRAGKNKGLGRKILEQFVDRPGGLYLPPNTVFMRVEGTRIQRIAWKIVRGLYWVENKKFLPDDTKYYLELKEPMSHWKPVTAEIWEILRNQPSKGMYGKIFDYKYLHAKVENLQLHLWGMLFWDRIIIFVSHHDPSDKKDC